jgi:hypothetical protein
MSRIVSTSFDNIGLYGCGSIARRNTNPMLNSKVFLSYVSSSINIVGRDNKWMLCVDTFMMLPANSLPVMIYSLHESNIVDDNDSLLVLLFAVKLRGIRLLLLVKESDVVVVVGSVDAGTTASVVIGTGSDPKVIRVLPPVAFGVFSDEEIRGVSSLPCCGSGLPVDGALAFASTNIISSIFGCVNNALCKASSNCCGDD